MKESKGSKFKIMNSRIAYILGLLIFGLVSIKYFQSSLYSYKASKDSEKLVVEIIERPICGKNNKVQIRYQDKEYSVKVPKNKCIRGDYDIGDKVEVWYLKSVDHFVLSDLNTEIGLYISIAFFLMPIFCVYKLVVSFTRKEELHHYT